MAQPSQKRAIANHRKRLARARIKRIEVNVPADDVALVRAAVIALRAGGSTAKRVREQLAQAIAPANRSGGDLVEFFQNSPLASEELIIERVRASGRRVDL
jgi:hypothetical protein